MLGAWAGLSALRVACLALAALTLAPAAAGLATNHVEKITVFHPDDQHVGLSLEWDFPAQDVDATATVLEGVIAAIEASGAAAANMTITLGEWDYHKWGKYTHLDPAPPGTRLEAFWDVGEEKLRDAQSCPGWAALSSGWSSTLQTGVADLADPVAILEGGGRTQRCFQTAERAVACGENIAAVARLLPCRTDSGIGTFLALPGLSFATWLSVHVTARRDAAASNGVAVRAAVHAIARLRPLGELPSDWKAPQVHATAGIAVSELMRLLKWKGFAEDVGESDAMNVLVACPAARATRCVRQQGDLLTGEPMLVATAEEPARRDDAGAGEGAQEEGGVSEDGDGADEAGGDEDAVEEDEEEEESALSFNPAKAYRWLVVDQHVRRARSGTVHVAVEVQRAGGGAVRGGGRWCLHQELHWSLRPLLHTLTATARVLSLTDDQEIVRSDILAAIVPHVGQKAPQNATTWTAELLGPPEPRRGAALLRMCGPAAVQLEAITLAYDAAREARNAEEYPPDVARGQSIPGVAATWVDGDQNDPSPGGLHVRTFSTTALSPMWPAIPDMSMPYNAACMAATVVVLWVGTAATTMTARRHKPAPTQGDRVRKAARVVLVLTSAVLLALYLDEDLRVATGTNELFRGLVH